MAPSLSLYLLGPLAIETCAKTLSLRYNKARALLAYLALESGFHTRESLAFLLWPEATLQQGREKLKRMLFELKEALGAGLLEGNRDVIRLRAEAGLWTDFANFNAAVDVAQRTFSVGASADLDRLSHAIALYRGEFLQGLELDDAPDFANWVDVRREQCRLRYLQAVRLLAEGYERDGDVHGAIERVRQWTQAAPLDDAAWHNLLRLLVRSGQRELAHQELERYRGILEMELGTEPSPALTALVNAPTAAVPDLPEPAAGHPDRRQLTVVSCEFVVLGEPEEVVEAMRGPVAQCEALLREASGHTVRTPSGGLLAYFGYPAAQEGSLKRAISAALSCSRIGQARDGSAATDDRLYVEVCLGVHTGVVISSVRDGVPDAGGVVSRLAAQLGGQGVTGEVIISDESRRLLGGAFAIEFAGRMYDRSQIRQIDTFRVVDNSRAPAPSPHRLENTFCGREGELQHLTHLWETDPERTILMLGEAGIGKSFLVDRFRAVNAIPGVTFKCSSELRQMPFHPLVRWVEGLRAEAALTGEPQASVDVERMELIKSVTDLLHASPGKSSAERLGLPSAKELLPRRLCRLIGMYVPRGGIVHFDDVQWADPSTRDLIALLAEKPLAQRLQVFTARNEFLAPWRNTTSVETLELTPLDSTAMTELVHSVAGQVNLPQPLMRQILSLSEGVPLYAEELTRELVSDRNAAVLEAGDSDAHNLSERVPRTLHDLLMSRIDSVGRIKPIAQFAAAAGSEFTLELLAAAMQEPKSNLMEAIATLLRQNLIVKLDDGRFAFRHALLREAAYQSQARAARVDAHRRLADVLAADATTTLRSPEALAWHYSRAGDDRLALRYALIAARKAAAKAASNEAVGHYRTALELVGNVGRVTEVGDPGDADMLQLEILMELGIQLGMLHGPGAPEVVECFQTALRLAKPLGDNPRLFPVYWGLWQSASSWSDFDMTYELSETLLRLAQASGDGNLMAHAMYARGYSYFFFGDHDAAVDQYRKAIAACDPSKPDLTLGEDLTSVAHAAMSISLWYLGQYDSAQRASEASIVRARKLNHRYSLLQTLAIASELQRLCGDPDAVTRLTSEGLALAQDMQAPLWSEILTGSEAWANAARGDVSAVAELALGVHKVSTIARGLVPFAITRWVEACDLVGDVQTGMQVAARGLGAATDSKDVHYLSEFQRYKGKFLFAQGQPASVVLPWLRRAVTTAQACGSPPLMLRAVLSLIRYSAAGGTPDALALLENALADMRGGEELPEVRRARALLDAATADAGGH